MHSNDTPTPGFAIVHKRRRRSAVSGRHRAVEPAAARAPAGAEVAERIAGNIDAIATGLAGLESHLDTTATLDPSSEDAIRARVAAAGAKVIDARYDGAAVGNQTILGLWKTIIGLEAELAQARDRQKEDAREIQRLRDRVRELAVDLHDSRRASVSERGRNKALESRVADLEEDLASATGGLDAVRVDEVTALRRQAGNLEVALRDLRYKLDSEQASNEDLQARNDLLRVQLAETEAVLRTTHAELVRTRAALATAETRIQDLEAKLGEQLDENDLMESWLDSALTHCAELRGRLNELEDALAFTEFVA